MLKLGKRPARRGAIKVKFADFFDGKYLPSPADGGFGHYGLGPGLDWTSSDGDPCMANRDFGSCVWTGFARTEMLWTHHSGAGEPVRFSDANILADYAAGTGVAEITSATDNGTDMQAGYAYWKKVGIIDAQGKRRKIDCYLGLELGNWQQFRQAMFLFGSVGIGIRFPKFAWDQFNAKVPWDWIPTNKWDGGHYIPGVGENSAGLCLFPSWDGFPGMTRPFWENCCDELCVAFSYDQLDARGYSADGYDATSLKSFMTRFA
jgi:hypothetical protein